jgi:probable rRNA maturation factor
MRKTRSPERAIDVDARGRRLALGVRSVKALGEFVLRRERARQALLSVSFVSPSQIARLNRQHLGHDAPTDVITFALGRIGPRAPIIGDIYVAPDIVREQAKANGESARRELARVVVHGILHALGRRHPDSSRRTASPMWRRQEALLVAADRAGLL